MATEMRRALLGLGVGLITLTVVAAAQQPMPKTTKEKIAGTAAVKTEQLHGTVIAVDGNHLAVKMSTGDLRSFDVPDFRRFVVDGKELSVGELKPGTKLTATVTTVTTPVTERTTTVGTGKVWYVAGTTVILTLPNNENRVYKVKDDYRFMVDGKKASVFDLRKGMTISAEKIVEEPKTEIASNTTVVGTAPPPPKPVVAEVAPPPAKPRPVRVEAPAAAPAPPVAPPAAERAAEEPAELPKTGSEVPLVGLLGLLSFGASLTMRKMRRG